VFNCEIFLEIEFLNLPSIFLQQKQQYEEFDPQQYGILPIPVGLHRAQYLTYMNSIYLLSNRLSQQ